MRWGKKKMKVNFALTISFHEKRERFNIVPSVLVPSTSHQIKLSNKGLKNTNRKQNKSKIILYKLPGEGESVVLIVQQQTAKSHIFLSDHNLQLFANTELPYLQPWSSVPTSSDLSHSHALRRMA